jgi:hypothetical protein
VVYPTTVGAFAVGVVSVDSHCWPSGEIFVDVCLTARSSDRMPWRQLPYHMGMPKNTT